MMLDENEQEKVINCQQQIPEIIPNIIEGDDGISVTPVESSLSTPLRSLFWCNGVSLSLPNMALLYIVNTRANIPLAYLSAYGAIAFLPFSLKPLYASLSRNFRRRDHLLTVLLAVSGVAIMGTACIPKDGVGWCFLLAFVRGFTGAWPEFLLGLTLIDQAMAESTTSFDHAAALFQAQAATCRNLGSLSANIVTFLLFAQRHYNADVKEELSSTVVTVLLVVTGMLPIVGAGVAFFFRVGLSNEAMQRVTSTPTISDSDSSSSVERDGILLVSSHTNYKKEVSLCVSRNDSYSSIESMITSIGIRCDRCNKKSSRFHDVVFVAIFQLMIVVFAIRAPFISFTSTLAWNLSIFLLAMTLGVFAFFVHWTASHRVGIYLAARHAVPSFQYLMSSYMYWLFQSSPVFLQIMSLVGTGCTTASSWSYGKVFAKFSSGRQLLFVICVTTFLAAAVSLCNIVLLRVASSGVKDKWLVVCSILVTIITSFFEEWRFLPSIVLATTKSKQESNYAPVDAVQTEDSTSAEDAPCDAEDLPRENDDHQRSSRRAEPCVDTTGIKYGTLVSCVDFGGQIGSWLMVPIVAALDITRENDWAHLDRMVVLCSIASVLSLALLLILPRTSA